MAYLFIGFHFLYPIIFLDWPSGMVLHVTALWFINVTFYYADLQFRNMRLEDYRNVVSISKGWNYTLKLLEIVRIDT